jgi:hypothetical protein
LSSPPATPSLLVNACEVIFSAESYSRFLNTVDYSEFDDIQ